MNILYYPNYKLMNHNIPEFKALVRRSWFTKDNADFDTFDSVFVFGLQSVQNKILTFHVMTDYGMLRSRVPLSEIALSCKVTMLLPGIQIGLQQLSQWI